MIIFKREKHFILKKSIEKKYVAQMVSYQNQPSSPQQRRLRWGRVPGVLSSCVAGNMFIQDSPLEVNTSLKRVLW